MLFRFDPYHDLDRLAHEVLGDRRVPQPMPVDCHRQGDMFFLTFDLPGIDTAGGHKTISGKTVKQNNLVGATK